MQFVVWFNVGGSSENISISSAFIEYARRFFDSLCLIRIVKACCGAHSKIIKRNALIKWALFRA